MERLESKQETLVFSCRTATVTTAQHKQDQIPEEPECCPILFIEDTRHRRTAAQLWRHGLVLISRQGGHNTNTEKSSTNQAYVHHLNQSRHRILWNHVRPNEAREASNFYSTVQLSTTTTCISGNLGASASQTLQDGNGNQSKETHIIPLVILPGHIFRPPAPPLVPTSSASACLWSS